MEFYYEKSFNDTGYLMPWQMLSNHCIACHFRPWLRDGHFTDGGSVDTYDVQEFHLQGSV
jgi:hypothetical protein